MLCLLVCQLASNNYQTIGAYVNYYDTYVKTVIVSHLHVKVELQRLRTDASGRHGPM